MAPRRYTELFFLDEATALAAGHRPCAECRREDFRRFQAAWRDAGGRVLPWRPAGYGAPRPRPSATRCLVLTPQPTVAALRAGYAPALHPSAA